MKKTEKIIEYDLTGLIPWFNDFFFFSPIRKVNKKSDLWKASVKNFLRLKDKYIPKDPKKLEKNYLRVKKKKQTSQNSYGGRVASLMQSYYLNHLRKVYIPGNTQWTKGYHKKINYRRSLPNILIDTKESPRKQNNVLTEKELKNFSLKPVIEFKNKS